jgi:hypothetical protein
MCAPLCEQQGKPASCAAAPHWHGLPLELHGSKIWSGDPGLGIGFIIGFVGAWASAAASRWFHVDLFCGCRPRP